MEAVPLLWSYGLPYRFLSASGRQSGFKGDSASDGGAICLYPGFEGEVPGASARDCGNYLDMNLGMAKYLAARYLKVLEQIDSYPESRLEYPQ